VLEDYQMKTKGCLISATIVGLLAGWIAPANATIIDYTLSPDASGTLAGGVTYDVSATFSWDTSTSLESNVNIVLTGSGSYAGTYTSTPGIIAAMQLDPEDNQDICGQNGSDAVCLFFDNALGALPDTLDGVATNDEAPYVAVSPTGLFYSSNGAAAVLATSEPMSPPANQHPMSAPANVPECSSISLLAVGLLGCAFILARQRRLPSCGRAGAADGAWLGSTV
jgi:hypothetical protein